MSFTTALKSLTQQTQLSFFIFHDSSCRKLEISRTLESVATANYQEDAHARTNCHILRYLSGHSSLKSPQINKHKPEFRFLELVATNLSKKASTHATPNCSSTLLYPTTYPSSTPESIEKTFKYTSSNRNAIHGVNSTVYIWYSYGMAHIEIHTSHKKQTKTPKSCMAPWHFNLHITHYTVPSRATVYAKYTLNE